MKISIAVRSIIGDWLHYYWPTLIVLLVLALFAYFIYRFMYIRKMNKILKKELQNYHNNDIAKVQPDLSEEEQEKLLKALDEEDLSDVVSYVEDFDEFIENMDTETVADIIEGMDVDDAVDALEELDEESFENEEFVEEVSIDPTCTDSLDELEDEIEEEKNRRFVKGSRIFWAVLAFINAV